MLVTLSTFRTLIRTNAPLRIKEDGDEAEIEEFLELVESTVLQTPSLLSLGRSLDEFMEYPPCMQSLFSDGVPRAHGTL